MFFGNWCNARWLLHPTTTVFFSGCGIAAGAARGMMRALFNRAFYIQGVQ
jgi:hypothetical protein